MTPPTGQSLFQLAATLEEAGAAPVERWHPAHCGEIDIRIRADGVWEHEGRPIARPALVKLFARVLRREPDGGYCLVTPVEKMTIRVEDLPFLAVAVESEGAGAARVLAFRLQTGDAVLAGPGHALTFDSDPASGQPRPALHVRGGLWARLSRPVYYELAELALAEHAGDGPAGLWSGGAFFPVGVTQ